jgi:hypothetical protein
LFQLLDVDFAQWQFWLLQMGAQYVITIFLAQRSIESMAQLEVDDLVWEESDTVEFSYLREVIVN